MVDEQPATRQDAPRDPHAAEDPRRQERWRQERRAAAEAHAASLARLRAAESAQARELVSGFVQEALRRGIRTRALRARAYSGGATYRTGLRGWYLMRQGNLAVDTDANYHVLTVPPSLLARVRGVTLVPEDPPLAVGRGARDGESMPLEMLLRLRLDGGDDW